MAFETLTEILLKNGIAPRHVRRYRHELSDHLDDLVQRQQEAGYGGEDAKARARALLGDDRELAAAMLAEPTLKSWPARAPWLFFVVLPPLVAVIAVIPLILLLYRLGNGAAPQEVLRHLSRSGLETLNIIFVPVVALLFANLARRQRLNPAWPLAGMALTLILFPHIVYRFGIPAEGRIGIIVAPLFITAAWNEIAPHWPVLAAQSLLCLVPAGWLIRMHRA